MGVRGDIFHVFHSFEAVISISTIPPFMHCLILKIAWNIDVFKCVFHWDGNQGSINSLGCNGTDIVSCIVFPPTIIVIAANCNVCAPFYFNCHQVVLNSLPYLSLIIAILIVTLYFESIKMCTEYLYWRGSKVAYHYHHSYSDISFNFVKTFYLFIHKIKKNYCLSNGIRQD